jgi:hypothetical protein
MTATGNSAAPAGFIAVYFGGFAVLMVALVINYRGWRTAQVQSLFKKNRFRAFQRSWYRVGTFGSIDLDRWESDPKRLKQLDILALAFDSVLGILSAIAFVYALTQLAG